jgi:hypothetical protein
MSQYDTFRDPDKVLHLQKQTLYAKLEIQIQFFKSLEKEELCQCVKGLLQYKERIDLQKDKRVLLRIEAGTGQHLLVIVFKM